MIIISHDLIIKFHLLITQLTFNIETTHGIFSYSGIWAVLENPPSVVSIMNTGRNIWISIWILIVFYPTGAI